MAHDAVPFRYGQYLVTDEELASWTVVRSAEGEILAVSGPCPNCGHVTRQDVEESVVAFGQSGLAAAAAPTERMTRICECACGVDHQSAAAQPVMSCGNWWLFTIALDANATAPVRAGTDASLLPALRAVQEVTATEESTLRSSAEKWIAAVTALVGLFGLAGVVVGKDAFTGLSAWARGFAGGAALVAAGCAAAAIVWAYKAAYGWPKIVDLGNDQLLTRWFSSRRTHLQTAVGQLRKGVMWALISLGALLVAIGCIWFWPRSSPDGPLVEVTRRDDSKVCGTLLDSKTDRGLRIRRPNGVVETVSAASLGPVKNVSSCDA
ncbi:hypothetical protein OG806_24715 [Streptomyces sp. NBC_00882]|uniref:hypothetical protein n=1 Tax=Streptomyces sp. NBC_00882 TaxID=2975856 RepID=UPI0038637929|nr:hypothetical protein OG806_24715 [Streptomyces sp. NBC_00882]